MSMSEDDECPRIVRHHESALEVSVAIGDPDITLANFLQVPGFQTKLRSEEMCSRDLHQVFGRVWS